MGQLKPGATYKYEKADGIIYATEEGQTTRFEVGRDHVRTKLDQDLVNKLFWDDVQKKADNHPALRKALDNVIMVYSLIKDDDERED